MKHAHFAILTGIITGTSYIPFFPWGILFYLVPLWFFWLGENSCKKIFWTGWLAQFTFTFIGFNWVSYTMHEFGHMPWPFAVLVLALFCSVANLYVPIVGVVWWWLGRKLKWNRTQKILALPVLTSLGERFFPMIFDWHMGYTLLWAKLPIYHLADIVGFIGLSNILLALNALLLMATLKWRAGATAQAWKWGLAAPAVFLSLNLAGAAQGARLATPDASVKALLVQANIENQEKLASESGGSFRDVVINRWLDLTTEGLRQGPADFVVWPETAFPDLIENSMLVGPYASRLKQAVIALNTPFITGGYSTIPAERRYTNSFFVLNPNGEWADKPYHKTVLLAFGEYFPLADRFPILRKWFPEVGDYGRGAGPTVLGLGEHRIGAQICYEGLFDWFSRDLAHKGAQILVNLTNDAWYGRWQQPYQHAYMTFARAVEVRRPLIRSTNSGISAVALASGEILTPSPIYQRWHHHYDVPYRKDPPPTVFMGWGFWLIPSVLLLAVVALFCAPFCKNGGRHDQLGLE